MRHPSRLVALLAATLLIASCAAAGTPPPTVAPTGATPGGSPGPSVSAERTPVALPVPETTSLKVGLSNNLAINQFIYQFARDLDLFRKHGLDVEVISMTGGAGDVVRGLVSQQLHVGALSAGAALSAALTDTPLVVTGLDSSALFYALLGSKDVKSAADLKGKAVAISSLGDVSHAAVLASLERLGLKSTDVVIQNIGNEAARINAVLSGVVAAAPVQTVNAKKVVDQGANVLVDLEQSNIKFGLAGVNTTREWYTQNPNTLLRVLAALLEAQKAIFTKSALAATAYQNFTLLDADTAKASIDACIAGVCNMGLRFTADDFKLNKDVLLTVNPAVAPIEISSVIDLGPLDRLQEMGFNAEIEFP